MKRIVIGLVFAALMSCQAMAQSSVRIQAQAVATCGAQTLTAGTFYPVDQDLTGTLCVSSSGGGGGGLSVTDQATWTNAVSAFTPTGGVFNDSATALTSGHQGTVRLNANREMHVTCDLGNVLCGLIAGPTPAGTAIIGKVGIDQTTPGTTNGVAIVGVNGATALAGNGVTGTGSPRVTISSDNTPFQVKQTDGTTVVVTDPCQGSTKSYLPITATTSLVKVIATGVSAKKIYICHIILNTTAANNVAVFEATTGTTCATATVAVYGAGTSIATAANGFPFTANGGVSLGAGGFSIGQTTVNNNDLCIGTSAATPLTGGITYVTQ